MVLPSMTYALPVMDDARSVARNPTSSGTSFGRFGRSRGMPPRASMIGDAESTQFPPLHDGTHGTAPIFCTTPTAGRFLNRGELTVAAEGMVEIGDEVRPLANVTGKRS